MRGARAAGSATNVEGFERCGSESKLGLIVAGADVRAASRSSVTTAPGASVCSESARRSFSCCPARCANVRH